jgi:alanyl-tRNA synthetase
MNSQAIRESFTGFFAEHGHREHRSVPLVPHGDATLLFTNAGMVPFKDYFLGRAKPPAPRAVSVQKCMRVSGKHNDLENVGPSHRHHTFFEMLGNFSFGDYFKAEAIQFAWELVTGNWGLDPATLFATVFEDDDEAAELWRKVSGLPSERVLRCGADDNFWAMGDTGPCGPCSEIFVDRTPERPAVEWVEGTESGRYLEIWNLVFMQFDRHADGTLEPLPRPSVDTGAGLERVASVLQDVDSNYETDLFQPILAAAAALAETRYGADAQRDVDLRVIADHLRAVTFLLADGVIPSNEGRGYVLRRILRRAVRHGMRLGFEEPFLHRLVPVVREGMGRQYPDLEKAEQGSADTVQAEEGKFLETLAAGSAQVQEAIEQARRSGQSELSGAAAFRFYDTHGLPLETLREIAEEEKIGLDVQGFERALEEQRARSRAALGATDERLAELAGLLAGGETPATQFLGYDHLESEGRIVALARFGSGGVSDSAQRVEELADGDEGAIVLDDTPFYAESGGQVGDRGQLVAEGGRATVTDTQKDATGTWYHLVDVKDGKLAVGDVVVARVRREWRAPTQRNHTATHLLHAALRHVLGPSVRQAGSLVAPDRLRFDFTHGRPLTAEEVERVEELVNRWVLLARGTEITTDRDYEEAVAAGAMALFGEKYGDRVRTVEVSSLPVEGAEILDSLELCGGCHVANTGEIGLFLITSERGVASGVRRIEALTGEGARAYLKERVEMIGRTASELGVADERLPEEAAQLRTRVKALERELSDLRMQLVSGAEPADSESEVEGIRVVAREVPPAPAQELRGMADVLKNKLGSGVVVLGSRKADRVSLVTVVSQDLTERLNAGDLAREIAALVDGNGGGRADFAQAGGRQPDQLPAALAAVPDLIRARLRNS